MSAVDRYIEKRSELARLYENRNLQTSGTLATLVVLGIVSAVESYCREVFRRTILLDDTARQTCLGLELPYGATFTLTQDLMPEALLEKTTFSNPMTIKKALKDFLDIGGHSTKSLNEVLEQFGQLCQLRHCAVHRFGRLGVKNAVKLGMDQHDRCIEKPLAMPFVEVQNSMVVADNLVVELNQFLFNRLLTRSVDLGVWTWDGRRDMKLFRQYCDVFFSLSEPAVPAITARSAYGQFRTFANG